MKNFIFLLTFVVSLITLAAEVKLSELPLNSDPSTIALADSFPYVMASGPTTKRLKVSDILGIPTFTTKFALYAPLASPTFTGYVSGISKAMVGLASADNTSDLSKPISTATQAALDLKANSADVSTALDLKANSSDVTSALATKANSADTTTALNGKLDLAGGTMSGIIDVNGYSINNGVSTIYDAVSGYIYDPAANLSIQTTERYLVDTSGNYAIKWNNRQLDNTANGLMLDWSTAGSVNVNSNKITNLATGTASGDATTKAQMDTALGLKLNLTGGTLSGTLRIADGSQGTAGYIFTSTNVSGDGTWAAAPSAGANTTLSNLGTTAINSDLIFNKATPIIKSGDKVSSTSEIIKIQSGTVTVSGSSGATTITTGDSVAVTGDLNLNTGNASAGASGAVNINSGTAASASTSGAITIASANTTGNASSGAISLKSGNTVGTQAPGSVTVSTGTVTSVAGSSLNLNTGNSTGTVNSGTINMSTGTLSASTGASSGAITIASGLISNAGTTGGTGALNLKTGNHAGAGLSGAIDIASGNNTGSSNSGSVTLESGTVTTNHNSGDIQLKTAAVSGSGVKGKIRLHTTSVVGQSWQADDTSGGGNWAAQGTPTLTMLTNTSSVKTPTASGNYDALTNNSVALTTGTWEVSCNADFMDNGTTAVYTAQRVGLYGANGADSGGQPTPLASTSNITVNSAYNSSDPRLAYVFAGNVYVQGPTYIVTTTATVSVYVVTQSVETTPANARITAYINARKLY